MNLQEYQDLADGMTAKEVEAIFLSFVKDDPGKFSQESIEKMYIICDKQWHTFESPSEPARIAVNDWVKRYIEIEDYDPELAARVVYCFGLEKVLLQQIIDGFSALDHGDYEQDMERSDGEFVDPYWSLRESDKRRP